MATSPELFVREQFVNREPGIPLSNVPLIGVQKPQLPPLAVVENLCRIVYHASDFAYEAARIRNVIAERVQAGGAETAEAEAYTLELIDLLATFQLEVRTITNAHDNRTKAGNGEILMLPVTPKLET